MKANGGTDPDVTKVHLSNFSFEEVSGGGHSRDEPLISERDKRELMSLCQENISMDFILEMREAFQLFDKVSPTTLY